MVDSSIIPLNPLDQSDASCGRFDSRIIRPLHRQPAFLVERWRWPTGRPNGRPFAPGTSALPSETTVGQTRSSSQFPTKLLPIALLSPVWIFCRLATPPARPATPALCEESEYALSQQEGLCSVTWKHLESSDLLLLPPLCIFLAVILLLSFSKSANTAST